MMSDESGQVVLYSDGGGEKGSCAAGACILEHPASGARCNLVLFLGPGTNNEAEISAGLLGFSLIAAISETLPVSQVRWVCDSEYVLKSATGYIFGWQRNGWKTADKKPVKNQSLWRTFLALSAGLKITPQHVRGHTGHRENELCDKASTWARNNAESLLLAGSETAFDLQLNGELERWHLLDGREFLLRLRAREGAELQEEDHLLLVQALQHAGITSLAASGGAPRKPPGMLERALSKLREARTLLASAEEDEERALKQSLDRLLKKYDS